MHIVWLRYIFWSAFIVQLHSTSKEGVTVAVAFVSLLSSPWVTSTKRKINRNNKEERMWIDLNKIDNRFYLNHPMKVHSSTSSNDGSSNVRDTEAIPTDTSLSTSQEKEKIRSMRVKDIQTELQIMGISTKGAFEKEELIKLLISAREERDRKKQQPSSVSTKYGSSIETGTTTILNTMDVLVVPMTFSSLQASQPIQGNDNVFLRPSPGLYASIQLYLPSTGHTLNMLVDTACSGIVVRPLSATRCNLKVVTNPTSTITSAGGTTTNTKVAFLGPFAMDATRFASNEQDTIATFGPLPVAVQDIGALPKELDGIIGLSFLQQFTCVDLILVIGNLNFTGQQKWYPNHSLWS